jgi:predicted RNase H-like nuclease (RuvC/YqgF family)
MAKSKDRSEIEYYKGEIRKLKAEIKQLHRQLAEQKRYIPEPVESEDEYEEIEEKTPSCPQCYTGELVIVDLNIKFLEKCRSCNYVKTRNK